MAILHVNSANGSPTAPYETWAKAATTLSVAAAACAAGDTIYVHNSHAETGSGAVTITTNGTPTAPTIILCGTPDVTTGITALAATASITSTGNVTMQINGSFYCYGIIFILTSASATQFITGITVSHLSYFEQCKFRNTGAGTVPMTFGSTSVGNCVTVLRECQFKFGHINQSIRINSEVRMMDCSFESGTSSPTTCFSIGNAASGSKLFVQGMDFSNLGAGFDVVGDQGNCNTAIFRNCKMPSSWTGALSDADYTTVTDVRLINYGSGDTNYKFWVEDRQCIVKDETTIVLTSGAQDEAQQISWRMTTLTNCVYPTTIARSPPIIKRVTTGAQTFKVHFCHDGASAFTDKEVWVELEYLGTSGFPLSTTTTNKPSYLTAAADNVSSGVGWDNDTGTGPNGSSTWNQLKFEAGLTIQEVSYVIATVCMGVASKTIFINPDIIVT